MMLMLAGCDALFGLERLQAEPADAAAVDSVPIDAPCFGTGMLRGLCAESPAATVALTSAIDTSSDPRCRRIAQADGPDLCVIEAETIEVTEYVPVIGEWPLVLLATRSVEIAAPLDASSKRGVRTGAGAQAGCTGGSGAAGTFGAGGGAGGTFGYVGGPGGTGEAGTASPRIGGAPTSVVPLLAVYGGCAGGPGGAVAGAPAVGGAGGGAIYVIAGEQIHVADSGMINASGAGGSPGLAHNGGGGGGAGGFIALDAPQIILDGPVFARGGGGGGGGGVLASDNGSPGADPAAATAPTPGGAPGNGGSRGGDGCGTADGREGGIVESATYGGGGGGGACGRIRLWGTRSGAGATNPTPS